MPENPNEYNDDLYAQRSGDLMSAVEEWWGAGAELDTLEGDIASGLENAGLSGVRVSISAD